MIRLLAAFLRPYWRALALKKLGRDGEAKQIFDDLISLGQRRLTVGFGMGPQPFAGNSSSARVLRMRCATLSASSARAPGSTTPNSSPPHRPTTSVCFTWARMAFTVSTSALSPTA